MAIRRKVVERATRRVDLVVVLIFALVGAELLTFLEEFVVPRSPQELDVASLGRRTKRLRPFEFASLDLVGVYRITEQGPRCIELIQSALPLPGSCCRTMRMLRLSWPAMLAMKVSTSCRRGLGARHV